MREWRQSGVVVLYPSGFDQGNGRFIDAVIPTS